VNDVILYRNGARIPTSIFFFRNHSTPYYFVDPCSGMNSWLDSYERGFTFRVQRAVVDDFGDLIAVEAPR
jgi:hypothetical protein